MSLRMLNPFLAPAHARSASPAGSKSAHAAMRALLRRRASQRRRHAVAALALLTSGVLAGAVLLSGFVLA